MFSRRHDDAGEAAEKSLNPRRLGLRAELLLAFPPTLLVLAVLGLVEVLSRQRVLFASLASSAYLIYLDPEHHTNTVKTLVMAHLIGSLCGVATQAALGDGYLAAGSALVITLVLMVLLNVVHPPAAATALSFAFRSENESNMVLFLLSLGLIATLVVLESFLVWMLRLLTRRSGIK